MIFPILDFDDDTEAIINPAKKDIPIFPKHCVISFYQKATEKLFTDGKLQKIESNIVGETGGLQLYKIDIDSTPVLICFPPGAGGPLAAMVLETLIGFGVNKFIVCGHGGVLRKDILRDSVMIVKSAIRQEGLSYHYIKPSNEIDANTDIVFKVEQELKNHNINPIIGKTWTTDSMFRETKSLIEKRKAEGAITVEMECASLFSVAQFRKVILCQLVCAGDDISGEVWDPRYVKDKISVREKMIIISAEVCSKL
jgi:uridine phosphorylase